MNPREVAPDPRRPPSPGREEKKAEVRRRILEAAKEIFVRDGFMDANLDEIAELAAEFDSIHSVERALEVGSLEAIVEPEDMRGYLIGELRRAAAR